VLAEHRAIQRWPASAQPFTISGRGDGVHGGAFFHGCLADVAVYTRALTTDEIAAHHVAGQLR
jgi:hypothetical protein